MTKFNKVLAVAELVSLTVMTICGITDLVQNRRKRKQEEALNMSEEEEA